MADIYLDFPIKAPVNQVYAAVSTPQGLDAWWTKRSSGEPVEGADFTLWFGPEYDWRARVTSAVFPSTFELQMTEADPDWLGTRVGFRFEARAAMTQVRFYHTGWPEANEHYRTSCHCWALYLRILRRHLEFGETVPYDRRLAV